MFEDLTRPRDTARRRLLLAGSALLHAAAVALLLRSGAGGSAATERQIDVLLFPPAPRPHATGSAPADAAADPARTAPAEQQVVQPTVAPDPQPAAPSPPADAATGAPASPNPAGAEPTSGADLPADAGGDVARPQLIAASRTLPDYPVAAQQAGLEGVVILKTIIDERGKVGDIQVLHGLGMGLDEAAVAAVRRWRFQPATRNGKPVKVFYVLSVYFHL